LTRSACLRLTCGISAAPSSTRMGLLNTYTSAQILRRSWSRDLWLFAATSGPIVGTPICRCQQAVPSRIRMLGSRSCGGRPLTTSGIFLAKTGRFFRRCSYPHERASWRRRGLGDNASDWTFFGVTPTASGSSRTTNGPMTLPLTRSRFAEPTRQRACCIRRAMGGGSRGSRRRTTGVTPLTRPRHESLLAGRAALQITSVTKFSSWCSDGLMAHAGRAPCCRGITPITRYRRPARSWLLCRQLAYHRTGGP